MIGQFACSFAAGDYYISGLWQCVFVYIVRFGTVNVWLSHSHIRSWLCLSGL
jgi:hypothetical protein